MFIDSCCASGAGHLDAPLTLKLLISYTYTLPVEAMLPSFSTRLHVIT